MSSIDSVRFSAYGTLMQIQNVPFMTTDWSKITPTEHSGEQGKALWRTLEVGNVRVRMAEAHRSSTKVGAKLFIVD